MSAPWFQAANEAEIPSPALFIFPMRAEANIDRMIEIAGGAGRLRPHVKTHKLAPLIRAQLERGITKFKCATIAEAEMVAAAGGRDVLLAYQPVGPTIGRLIELQRRFPESRFSAIVDQEETVRELSTAAQAAGIVIPVLLDLDCGMHRTGIEPGPEAVRLYRMLSETKGLKAAGLHAYDGHINAADAAAREAECEVAFLAVEELRLELVREGLPLPPLVAGGAPTFAFHARYADRELSPGTTVLWDFGYGDKFPELPFEPAAVLLTRVVSKPGKNRLCLDLGHKAVAADATPPRVKLLEHPEAIPVMHSEEHLVVEMPDAAEIPIGTCLHGVPRHVCPTVALHERAWVVAEGAARDTWPITARARKLTI